MNDNPRKSVRVSRELRRLADSACNDTLTNVQRVRLEQLLRDDPPAQLAYLAYLDIHAQLLWEGRSGAEPATELPPDLAALLKSVGEEERARSTPMPHSPREGVRRSHKPLVRWAVAAASVAVLIAVMVIGSRRFWIPQPVPTAPATWLAESGAEWRDAGSGQRLPTPEPGDPLVAGSYALSGGFAAVRFASGAEITLQAPTQFRIVDPYTGGLDAGRLVAVVPDRAAGFTIRTPHGSIVDRGTEFAVAVDGPDGIFVQVHEGRVEVEPKSKQSVPTGFARRVWPLTAMRIPGKEPGSVRIAPFEPFKFQRGCPDADPGYDEVATAPRVSLDDDPNATAHVKALAATIETAPACRLALGAIYENFAEVNDLTQSEMNAFVPALLEMLDDRRFLPLPAGRPDPPVRLRVCERAELALQFIAGSRPAGEARPKKWSEWWASARGKSRAEWLRGRQDTLRATLAEWRGGAAYPENLHARNAVEIVQRARDEASLPLLLEFLGDELPLAHVSETCLAAVLDCVGRLGGPELAEDLVDQARQLNDWRRSSIPQDFSEPHERRGTVLQACARALDRLAGTELSDDALQTIGPQKYGMWTIDEAAFPQWLAAARKRAAQPDQRSPSDLPESAPRDDVQTPEVLPINDSAARTANQTSGV